MQLFGQQSLQGLQTCAAKHNRSTHKVAVLAELQQGVVSYGVTQAIAKLQHPKCDQHIPSSETQPFSSVECAHRVLLPAPFQIVSLARHQLHASLTLKAACRIQ